MQRKSCEGCMYYRPLNNAKGGCLAVTIATIREIQEAAQ